MAKSAVRPKGFARADLDLAEIEVKAFLRLYPARYPSPLGFGKTPSRFADPRHKLTPEQRFGVIYLGQTLEVCFLEAVLRDRAVATTGSFPLSEAELQALSVAEIHSLGRLRLVDLRGGGAIRMRIPTNVVRGASHQLSMRWSLAFHQHPSVPDGIVYHSRLNGAENIAVYDRTIPRLQCKIVQPLMTAPELATILTNFRVTLVP